MFGVEGGVLDADPHSPPLAYPSDLRHSISGRGIFSTSVVLIMETSVGTITSLSRYGIVYLYSYRCVDMLSPDAKIAPKYIPPSQSAH